ncbi:MAG: hypothetical protein VYA55_16970 [Pseudomonadota bacterium]|nr:hypothetical protein [Pseudomonadota bacterium]
MPKIYFAKKQLGDVTGASIHVRYSYGAVFQGSVDNKLTAGVNEGLTALNYVVNYLNSTDSSNVNGNFKYFFERFFLTQNYNDAETLGTIGSVLALTKTGLAKTTIKVYSKGHNDPKGLTAGYVTSYWGKGADQKHRNQGTHHGPNGSKAVYKGDIHMGSSVVKNGTQLENAALFLHEATHKYASTSDFGNKGYTTDKGYYREEGLTPAQALNNADTYARFVMHFYRKESGGRQW